MQPTDRPERDTAAQEARLAAKIRGEVPDDWRLTWSDVIVIVLAPDAGVGLYVLHLHLGG